MKWIKYTLITLLILILLSATGFVIAFSSYGLDQYDRMNSPYKLNEEYNTKIISRLIRGYAAKIGIEDNSWILSPVLTWHRKAYEKAMKVIPENDAEKILWRIDYKIRSFDEVTIEQIDEIYENIIALQTLKSKNRHVNTSRKYVYLSGLIWYIIHNRDEKENFYYRGSNRKKLLSVLLNSLDEIKLKSFFEEWYPPLDIYPLRILLATLVIYLDSDFYEKLSCPEKKITAENILKKYQDYSKWYGNIKDKKNFSNQFQILQKHFTKNENILKQITQSCKQEEIDV